MKELNINIAEFESSTMLEWELLGSRVQKLNSSLGLDGVEFENILEKLKRATPSGVVDLMTEKRFRKGFIYLIKSSVEFFRQCFSDSGFVRAYILVVSEYQIELAEPTFEALLTFYGDKSLVKSDSPIVALSDVCSQNDGVRQRFNRLIEFDIFSDHGITKMVNECHHSEKSVETFFAELNLSKARHRNLFQTLKQGVLLEKLKSHDFTQSNSMLMKEVNKQDVLKHSFEYPKLFGHAVITLIISACTSVAMDQSWIQFILETAGDPRISQRSGKYNIWWRSIDDVIEARFKSILSHSDITIFLEALDEYAYESGNSEMVRMFAARKKLLIALSLSEQIKESRLFLSPGARAFIKRNYPSLDTSFAAELTESQHKSMILLDLGRCSVLEGSHSCYFRIYQSLPFREETMNPNNRSFTYWAMTSGLEYRYQDQTSGSVYRQTHNGEWKYYVINVLKREYGIELSKEEAYSSDELSNSSYSYFT